MIDRKALRFKHYTVKWSIGGKDVYVCSECHWYDTKRPSESYPCDVIRLLDEDEKLGIKGVTNND